MVGSNNYARLDLRRVSEGSKHNLQTILVVDDEPNVLQLVESILEEAGYSVIGASSADSAIKTFDKMARRPDLLLTDVVMPGMSGVDLAIAVRNDVPDCRILLFSGQAATVDLLGEAGKKGHDFTLLSKPLHPKDLLARVSQTLGSRDSNPDNRLLEREPCPELSA